VIAELLLSVLIALIALGFVVASLFKGRVAVLAIQIERTQQPISYWSFVIVNSAIFLFIVWIVKTGWTG
jgi:hypothetical protein